MNSTYGRIEPAGWITIGMIAWVLFPALSLSAQDEINIPSRYQDTLNIVIAAEPDYPPFSYVTKDGIPAGFSIDVFRAAAEAVNISYTIQIGVWDDIRTSLKNGTIDALPFVGRTPEREPYFDFTMPYLSLHGDVFIRKSTFNVNKIDDLKDKRVVVMKGDNAEEYARRFNISDYLFTVHTYEEAFKLLSKGEYDAVITQRITGLTLIKEKGFKNVKPLNIFIPDFRQDFCFAVTEGNRELRNRLNEGLSVIIANDSFEAIRERWLGPLSTSKLDPWEIIRQTVFISIPLLILFLLASTLVFRRQVVKRTEKLKLERDLHRHTAVELEKQKRLLNEMEQVTNIGGWEYEPESKKFTWTDGVYAIYGLKQEASDPPGLERSLSYYMQDDRLILTDAFDRLLKEGVPYSLELKFRSADGNDKWVFTSGYPVLEGSRLMRVYGNIADITQRKLYEIELNELKDHLQDQVRERTAELEEQIQKLDRSEKALLYMVEDLNDLTNILKEERRKLEISNRELEAFTYSVSHDLRAPLRGINGFTKILLEDAGEKLDNDGKKLLSLILDSGAKMEILINELLNLSRVARAGLKRKNICMNDLVKTVYTEVATEQEKEEFVLEVHDLPDIHGDEVLIRQVWQNYLSNALKYSSKSAVKKIIVDARQLKENLVYSVRDHGAGFDPAYDQKLFGVFQRLHSDHEFPGVGVGLAIVQRIIHRHGGRVWAEGKPGKGATFYFSLPLEGSANESK